MMTRLYN